VDREGRTISISRALCNRLDVDGIDLASDITDIVSDVSGIMSDLARRLEMETHRLVDRVLEVAKAEGLIPPSDKDAKVSGRIHRGLLNAAKRRTGIESETALLEYALAKVAIEDDFGAHLAKLRGTVSKDVDLEF
jgi:hypothetical protein